MVILNLLKQLFIFIFEFGHFFEEMIAAIIH